MRFLIAAAGEGKRWGNHLGVPKHLIEIDGERLLDRTVRQFSPHGETLIVAPPGDERYGSPPARIVHPDPDPRLHGVGKLLSSREHWSGETVLLLGDVWFSTAAVNEILRGHGSWWFAGRMGASAVTGGRWGEIFAAGFNPEAYDLIDGAARKVARLGCSGRLPGAKLWHLYRLLSGARDLKEHRRYGHWVEIDDRTEDFDTPRDLAAWLK
jgi:hypothetical protein